MTIQEALKQAQNKLKQAKIKTARLDGLVLLEFVTHKQRSWLLAHDDEQLSKKEQNKLKELIQERAERVPLAYLINHKEFYGLDFYVDENVLIPRPESEALVKYTLENAPDEAQILDMGTGCGALAIAIAATRKDLAVTASENSPKALEVAQKNADKHELDITFIESDLFANINQQFDLIVANLPYLKPKAKLTPEAEKEPRAAYLGGEADGLELYRKFFRQAPDYLKAGGQVVIEADPWQHPDLTRLAKKQDFQVKKDGRFMLALVRKS